MATTCSFRFYAETISSGFISPAKTRASKFQQQSAQIKQDYSKLSAYERNGKRFGNSISQRNVSLTRQLLSEVEAGCLENALHLFDNMNVSSTFVWNVVIRGLTDNGMFERAIDYYYRMRFEGVKADYFTFPFVVKACTGIFSVLEGQKFHALIIKLGLDFDTYVSNSLISMYAKFGLIEDMERGFEGILVKDLVSWNSMLSGYVSAGDGWRSLMCLREMLAVGLKLDRFSMLSGLNCCALMSCLTVGKEIHCKLIRSGLEFNPMIQASTIDMYGKCGHVDYAERISYKIDQKNVIIWNALIGACALNDRPLKSFAYLGKMQEIGNLNPDVVTLINLLPCCAKLGTLAIGKCIHGHAIRKGFLPHTVLETALVDMYGKCSSIEPAERTFQRMKRRNLIACNSMIAAYVQNGHWKEAIDIFSNLHNECFTPDEMTLASILPAYAETVLPREGKQFHSYIYKLGYSSNTFIANALIHLYAKCGDLHNANEIFDGMLFKDVISWNTIIMAYAIHGFGEYSIKLFGEMRERGFEPNGSTFVSLLSSCSTTGLVDEGWEYFNSMKNDYGIDPGIEHYGCMLDLLGRAGNLVSAKCFIDEMHLKPNARIWGSLLNASRHHRDIEVAELATDHILSLDHDSTGCYILLSNMYAEVGKWQDVERIRGLMKSRGLEKTVGCSKVECKGEIYSFFNNDRSLIQSNLIYEALEIISRRIGEDPYVHSISKFKPPDLLRRRQNSPMCHCVRLAICFGLISTSFGKAILVRSNTRICEYCHTSAKKISAFSGRKIIVGDPKIYHHFKDGHCSCGDYW